MFNRKYSTSSQSGAPIFQPAMLELPECTSLVTGCSFGPTRCGDVSQRPSKDETMKLRKNGVVGTFSSQHNPKSTNKNMRHGGPPTKKTTKTSQQQPTKKTIGSTPQSSKNVSSSAWRNGPTFSEMHPLYVNTEPTSKPLQNDNLKNELVYILDVVQGYSIRCVPTKWSKWGCWNRHAGTTCGPVQNILFDPNPGRVIPPPKNGTTKMASCWILHGQRDLLILLVS